VVSWPAGAVWCSMVVPHDLDVFLVAGLGVLVP
jgi:hypothetical protein